MTIGGAVHQFSDSQFGHIFAYGENRSQSRKHMVVALKELGGSRDRALRLKGEPNEMPSTHRV